MPRVSPELRKWCTAAAACLIVATLSALIWMRPSSGRHTAEARGNSRGEDILEIAPSHSPSPILLGEEIPTFSAPAFDRSTALESIEAFHRTHPGIHRFAHPVPVELDPSQHGLWSESREGTALWRCLVESPGALSLSLAFTDFFLPQDAVLTLSAPSGPSSYRFTPADNDEHGQLWTPLLKGDRLLLALTIPKANRNALRLRATRVHHGLVPEKNGSSDAGSHCHIDTACRPGDLDGLGELVEHYRPQARSAVAYTLDGVDTCSATLLNNTAEDKTPYLLTAFHCGVDEFNAPSLVVYWNYENSMCRTPGSPANGQPGDGSRSQFNSGAVLRAAHDASDFALLELDDPVHAGADPYFAGWNRSADPPEQALSVHHPDVEEKRVALSFSPVTKTDFGSFDLDLEARFLRVLCWDFGSTEGGSSGAALFDANGLVVGQLRGGDSACGNDGSDWFGSLAASWEGGGTASTRLRDWLDPLSAGSVSQPGSFLQPSLTMSDAEAAEGDSGVTFLTFTLVLSEPASAPVAVRLRLASGTATAGTDYQSPGDLEAIIPPGSTSSDFAVPIVGDTEPESDEIFYVDIESVNGAARVTRRATGRILNDDFVAPVWNGPLSFDLNQDTGFEAILEALHGPNVYSLEDPSPAGISLDSASGRISWNPDEAGEFDVRVLASNPAGQASVTLTFRVAPNPLRAAADAPAIPWHTGPNRWIPDATTFHRGPSSLASPTLADNESAWVETHVEGPDHLLFWWKASSEPDYDVLYCALDGSEVDLISGETDWSRLILTIPAGSHSVRWYYRKDSELSEGDDRVWVDDVQLLGAVSHPYIVSPLTTRTMSGQPFVYRIEATGTAPRLSSGPLPAGLQFSADEGILSGVISTPGVYPIQLEASNALGRDTVVLEIIVSLDIGEAVEAPQLEWTTGGDASWNGTLDPTAQGEHAAHSPALSDSQSAWVETRIQGPDTLLFHWKASTEERFDFLELARNGQRLAAVSGETGWLRHVLSLPRGPNQLRWTFLKDESAQAGADRAWLDAIRLASQSPTPILLAPPRIVAPAGTLLDVMLDATGEDPRFSASGLPAGVFLTDAGRLTGAQIPPGIFPVSITATNPIGSDTAAVELAFLPALAQANDALESPALKWFGQPGALWVRVADDTADDRDALRSAAIADNEESWIETRIQGPGNINFSWKVSSELDFDFLTFELNEAEEAAESGSTGWLRRSHTLPAGLNTLRWTYSKDESMSDGGDAGWLDRVRLSGYAAWTLQHPDPEMLDSMEDSDADGASNLIEWAFDLNPYIFDSFRLPQAEATQDGVFLTVPKLQNASRLLYSVEASDTLAPGSWSALGLEIREDSSSRLIVRDQIDPALRHTRAFRVRVRWRP